MAKNPNKPVGVKGIRPSDGPERKGATTEALKDTFMKKASYGHFGSEYDNSSVLEPGDGPNRKPRQGSQRVERGPVREIVRQWATPSYDPATGRAARVGDDKYTKTSIEYRYEDVSTYHGKSRRDGPVSWEQIPDAGDNTNRHTNNTKSRTRPGRW